MSLFFSPAVKSYAFLISHHEACHVIQQLISTGFIQFQLQPYDDSSDPFYLIFMRVKTLKHKIIKMIQKIQQKYSQQIKYLNKQEKVLTIGKMKDYMYQMQIDHLKYLDIKQHQIQDKFKNFNQLSNAYQQIFNKIQRNYQQLQICKIKMELLTKSNDFQSQKLTLITGACENKQRPILQRLLFRKTHGHCYSIFIQRENYPHKFIFLCILNKSIFKHLGQKLLKIFELNNVQLYQVPNMQKNLKQHQFNVLKENQQLLNLLRISGEQLTEKLRQSFIGGNDSLRHQLVRTTYLQRLLYIICHSKKLGNSKSSYLLFNIHLPADKQLPKLPISIIPSSSIQNNNKKNMNKSKNRTILPRLNCLHEVNLLTQLYSIPKHNQIIPSIFMFSTVPILFGMMFSDFGHGLMLLAICYFMKLSYLFYFMAFMSIYTGIIYNQFFGMKIIISEHQGILNAEWGIAQNGLNFQNSLKMKISMIIAFVHMSFGLILKIINQLKRSQYKHIIYDSIPKIGLLFTTVGYLVLLIICKWLTNFMNVESTAPSIINSMLQLYLGWNQHRKHSIFGHIQTQKYIENLMINFNIFFILVMVYNHTIRHKAQEILISIFSYKNKKIKKQHKKITQKQPYIKLQSYEDQDQDVQISEELEQEGHRLTNVQISQQYYSVDYYKQTEQNQSQLGPLQVFQYILSLISSTTSYLRLFALSLAHAKLSHLLLTFLLSGLSSYEPNLSIIKCLAFFIITVGMMLTLDVMECMMHVVRLHWVQWMGKFYVGGGKIFKPEIQADYQ